MAVEYDTCASSASALTTAPSIKRDQISKNLVSRKKCRRTCCYICLGALTRLVRAQIQKKYTENDPLHLVSSKYIEHLYTWANQCKYKQFFVNDFLKSIITSLVLFTIGVKLTNELVAWRLY